MRANLSGAFLQEITKECFTQTQINEAVGNDATRLPDRLQRPALEAVWEEELEGSCNETSSLSVRWMRSVWPSQRSRNALAIG